MPVRSAGRITIEAGKHDGKPSLRQANGASALVDNRPEAIAQRKVADGIPNSSRMVAQRQQLLGMFGDQAQLKGVPEEEELLQGRFEHRANANTRSTVVQGYFTIGGQKTNDPGIFPETFNDETPVIEKREYVWKNVLEPALAEKGVSVELRAEFKRKALNLAMGARKYNLQEFVEKLDEVQADRIALAVPLSDRVSPASLPRLSGTPELEGKEKHSTAKYARAGGEEETFSSDDYTKGPAKRRRASLAPTTPKGGETQVWTAGGVKESIQLWTCKTPLSRHLAGYIWPLVKNSEEGKKWELKFREIDRLIDFRDNESQSSTITIIRKSDDKPVKTLERRAYTVRARELLKAALLAGTTHPADQQDVLFYDTLLRADVNKELQDSEGDIFNLNSAYKAGGPGLSMLLTHWRPIIFFDWILAEDVMNNAS